jgi:predicted amidohydrolase YtcJ
MNKENAQASKGSLEPGKLADLVVLRDDPFEMPADALRDVRADTTAVGGRVVHE